MSDYSDTPSYPDAYAADSGIDYPMMISMPKKNHFVLIAFIVVIIAISLFVIFLVYVTGTGQLSQNENDT